MRTTVTIDDALWNAAKESTGIKENSELIRKALRELVAWEAQRQLAALGGSMPGFKAAPRGRPEELNSAE
jgi:Arc/MetJ family transcription regulator